MCSIIYKMLRSAHITGGTRRAGWWKAQVRPFVFVLLFIWVFVSIFAYRAHMWDNTPAFRSAMVSFVSCVLANNGAAVDSCGNKPVNTPNLGIWFLVQLAIAGQGLFATLIFGTQWQNVLLWWGLLSGKGANFVGTVESRGTIETATGAGTGTGTGSRSGKSAENGNGSRPGSAHHLARTASGRLDTKSGGGGGGSAGAGSYQNAGAVAPLSGATVARISAHVPPVLGASVSGLVASPSGVHVGFAYRDSFGGGAPASPRGLAAPPANPHLSDNPVLAGLGSDASNGGGGGGSNNGTMTAEQHRAAEHECVVSRENIPSDEDRI